MAGIGGLSSSVTSGASSIRGYGGLASGLDRDGLIESMTAGTTSKIYKQQQAKQKLEWEQKAMREITTKMYEFSQKYMSYTSSNNLLGSNLFTPGKVNALGKYGDLIGVTGYSSMAEAMSILGVKQTASNAQAVFKENASTGTLSGNSVELDMDADRKINMIGGSSFTVTYGTKNYVVSLPQEKDGYNYDSTEGIAKALNDAMKEVSVGKDKTLADVMKAEVTTVNGEQKLTLKSDDAAAAGNTIKLRGDTNDLLKRLGFVGKDQSVGDMAESALIITSSGLTAQNAVTQYETKTNAEWLAGQEISFTYNGKTETIRLGTAEELKKNGLQGSLQKELDKAFGKGRVKVELASGADGKESLSFKTVTPDGKEDKSSVFAINHAGRGILGENGVLGIRAGSANRLNLEASIGHSGLKTLEGKTLKDSDADKLIINGVAIEGLSTKDSLKEIINKINNTEGVGVKVSYQSAADKFIITSTMDGASGEVNIEGSWAEALFGKAGTSYEVQEGRDAIVAVKYEGSDEVVELVRGSNTFDLNGMNVTVKGTFGYEEVKDPSNPNAPGKVELTNKDAVTFEAVMETDKTVETNVTVKGTFGYEEVKDPSNPNAPGKVELTNKDAVTFEAVMETDKTVETVKTMIEDFNKILELVNKELTTKPNRKFAPLTSAQEDEMTESEIEKWNEKASAGMLFNDSDLRGLANSLRFLVSTDSTLKEMGIGVSSNYSDNGKLTFDEEKFRKALEADPEKVREAFTAQAEKDSSGNVISQGGLMVRMQTINNKYAGMTGSTKGILVERAGSTFAPTTILKNSLQKQMDAIDGVIERLQTKLKIEQDRYISQFTSLETLISQMNSQSSWLSSAFGS